MAKVLGFDNDIRQKNRELESTLELQRSLIEELVKLNEGYEEEVKRLVTSYDALYEEHMNMGELLKHYDPDMFGYPKIINKDLIRKNRKDIEGVEFIDFSKTKTNE
jgi:hypothetical protein